MAFTADLASLENPAFKAYVFWTAILIIKMLAMSILTAVQRFRTKTFPNPEDLLLENLTVKFNDPNVERVRRAHRNDLENLLPFFVIAYFYVITGPSALVAVNLIRVVGISRLLHTFVYAVYVVPQPARALSWFAAYIATGYMAVIVLLAAL